MGTGQEPPLDQDGEDRRPTVDARNATGVQVGEGNTQIIYSYSPLTWADSVASPPPLVSVSGKIDSPYRGLNAFEERDSPFFFGRETSATEILARLSGLLQTPGLLVVSGVSGAGKSSLLQAGVLPRIRGAGLTGAPGSASWPCLVINPTRAPLDELASGAALLTGTDAASVRRGLDEDPRGFALTARQAAGAQSDEPVGIRDQAVRRLLLVVDQFEQVFTQCGDEEQRRAFITALHAAATTGHGPAQIPAALVVLVVRADFEARCADYEQLAAAVQQRYLVTGMTERQVRLAITEPAKMASSQVDDALVEVLLREMRSQVAAPSLSGSLQRFPSGAGLLPLLSHALDQAWRNRAGDILGLADYERIGGIEGGVAASASRAYERLTVSQQSAAREIFMRLTITGSDGAISAARVSRADFTAGKSPAEVRDVESVLEAFAAERLLTLGSDFVEISHEVLITAWERLRDWLDGDQFDRALFSQLTVDARTWDVNARASSYLYRPGRLAAIDAAAGRWASAPARYLPLSALSSEFLNAARRAARSARRRRRAIIAGLLTLILAVTTAAGIAWMNAANANKQHAIALSRQLAAEGLTIDPNDPITARQLAVAAWRTSPTDQARSLLTSLLSEQQQSGMLPVSSCGDAQGVVFSPDSRMLTTVDFCGFVRFWDPLTGQPHSGAFQCGSQDYVDEAALSSSGNLLAVVDNNGNVQLCNTLTGQPEGAPLHANTSLYTENALAFSADGKLLATASDNGTVRLWDTVTGQHQGAVIHVGTSDTFFGVSGLAFSPNDKILAGIYNGTVRFWDPLTGKLRGPHFSKTSGTIATGIAFSPNGALLAVASDDGVVQLWNMLTGRPQGKPIDADMGIGASGNTLAFSPDGSLLATTNNDGAVQLWNALTGEPKGAPLGVKINNPLNSTGVMTFSPNGLFLAIGESDGTVRLWNVLTGEPQGAPSAPASNGGIIGITFNPHSILLAVADSDGTVQLRDPRTGQHRGKPIEVGTHPGRQRSFNIFARLNGIAISPDGKLLAAAYSGGAIQLWNLLTGQPRGRLLNVPAVPPPHRFPDVVNGMAFSPDGRLLAAGDTEGTVRLWNPLTGQAAGKLIRVGTGFGRSDIFDDVNGMAFSPDGKLLAIATSAGNVQLWDPLTGVRHGTLLRAGGGPFGRVSGVAFSPDGKILATNGNGFIRLWDPLTGKPDGAPLQSHSSGAGGGNGVAFSPDGMLLAASNGGGTVGLWNVLTGQPIGVPLQVTTDPYEIINEVAFSPYNDLLATATATVQLWNISLFANPYQALCADVGAPTQSQWDQYAGGGPEPSICN